MATRRYAKALVSNPSIEFDRWMEGHKHNSIGTPEGYVSKIAKTVLRKCDPNRYLLSHATIVASVDTYSPRGAKIGKQLNRGVEIDVKWTDYRVKPECHQIINNNFDAWSRPLLLSTYRTFIGAHNYLEHIQLPELSKGFIVDAIARDLGHSVYVDILVATDKKHEKLISDILSEEMTGLSMGCISLFTTCTKCGNVSNDDSQSCPCLLYDGKGSKFVDEEGVEHTVSELIGHVTVPNSNQFIEASWVKNPAFFGAQRRSFLNDNASIASSLDESSLIYEIKSTLAVPDGIGKAASSIRVAEGEEDEAPEEESSDPEPDADPSDEDDGDAEDKESSSDEDKEPESGISDKLESLVDQIQEKVLESVLDGIDKELAPKADEVLSVTPSIDKNDNLVRSFNEKLIKYFKNDVQKAKWAVRVSNIIHSNSIDLIKNSKISSRELIVFSLIKDRINQKIYPTKLYETAIKVGSIENFPNQKVFLAFCELNLGRRMDLKEKQFFIKKGKIASLPSS